MSNEGKKAEPVHVNKWDGNAAKHALDDAVKKILNDKYKWSEVHTLADWRLLISIVAVGFALFALAWDYLHPFPESQNVLILCVITYFLLMCVLQFYMWYLEVNVFYEAVDDDPTGREQTTYWKWSSHIKKYDDMYTMETAFVQGKNSGQASVTKSLGNWIDEDGFVCTELLEKDVVKMRDSLATAKKRN